MLCKLGPVWGQRWDGSSESFTVYKSAQDVKAVLCLPLCLPLQAFPLILGVLFKKAPKCSVSENETLSSHKAGRCISPGEDPESVEKQALVFKLHVRKVWALRRLPGGDGGPGRRLHKHTRSLFDCFSTAVSRGWSGALPTGCPGPLRQHP